jgi:hypothetical protein
MGEPTLVGFGVLAFAGLALVAVGVFRRIRLLVVLGSAILLALAGAWIFGPLGAMVGAVAFLFLRRPSGTE